MLFELMPDLFSNASRINASRIKPILRCGLLGRKHIGVFLAFVTV